MDLEQILDKIVELGREELRIVRKRAEEKTPARDHDHRRDLPVRRDFGDAALLESALTEDAAVDLTSATTKLGLDFPVLAPRDVVVGALVCAVGPLDTSQPCRMVSGRPGTCEPARSRHALHACPRIG
jgi:hypothetical protein